MKLDALTKSAFIALSLLVFAPVAFAADEPAEQNQEQANREPSSKHKGKRKHRGHGRKHHRK